MSAIDRRSIAYQTFRLILLHSRKANYSPAPNPKHHHLVGNDMGPEDNAAIGEILEKVDTLAEELASIRKDLAVLGSIPGIAKKVDGLISSANEIGETMQGIHESKEYEVIIKKLDDILIGMSEPEVITKKLDDLQGYIAGLSGIEEKVEDLSSAFRETQEIVGIIVRQLDDIERKYNLSIDKISETAETVARIAEGASSAPAKATERKTTKNDEESAPMPEKKAPVTKSSLPSTIDALMDRLLNLVNPQTEATRMAEALEEVRDELTSMLQGHTPVLFQFGKKARELKSYPPTATLNENDIAGLNKDIKSWASKLKEIAKSS